MNTEKKLIPSRRFPIYHNEKGWKNYKLNDIITVVNDKCSVANLCIETYISTENILPNYGGIKIASKLPTTGTFTRFKKGDVLFSNIRPYLKKVWWANFDGVASNDIIVFRALTGFDACFISHIIKNDAFITYSMKGAKGVKMPRGDKDMMLQYEVYVPNIEEQKEIAECLSSIDSYISSVNEKVEQLKAHKKSLLQKLFPQGGKTIPEYRFPEFEKDGSWKEKELGELIVEIEEFTSRGNNVPLYSLTIEDGVSPKTDRYERNFLVKKEGDNFKVVHPDDFVSNPMNLRFGAIGYNKESFKVCVSGYYDVFRFRDKGTSSFWINYMKSNWALDMYDKIATGSLYEKRRVHFSNFLRMKLLVPKYSERCKISEYLSSMDEVISLYSEKASLLEQHKKGLMQQLFPE